MMPLFSETGLQRLDQIAQSGLLCVFDFDGTLSPIVLQPERASLPLGVLQRLTELQALAPIAIITGRSVADIRGRLGWTPDFLIGNHGLEGLPGWEQHSARYAAQCQTWSCAITDVLQDTERYDAGIFIEDKQYSLAVHYRLARERAKIETELHALLVTLQPLPRLVAGKFVINLLPQNAPDKGHAIEQLMRVSGAKHAIYVGDDVTDEDVFRLRRADLLTIRIERSVDSAADFFLHHRPDIMLLLDELISRLHKKKNLHEARGVL